MSEPGPRLSSWLRRVNQQGRGLLAAGLRLLFPLDALQGRLALWLSIAILGVGLIAGAVAYISGFQEAHELQDDMLSQVAALMQQNDLLAPTDSALNKLQVRDPDARLLVQRLPASPSSSGQAATSQVGLPLPSDLSDGLHTLRLGPHTYRVVVANLGLEYRFAVAQETEFRDELARDSGLRTLIPFFFLVPLLLFLASFVIHRIFAPISTLALQLDRRSEQELHPIAEEPFPLEIRPFISAINRLLARVDQSLSWQRRFIADAAHELRSPMTALSLQAERLERAEMSASAHERLQTLRQGLDRARKLLDQLLSFARAQTSGSKVEKSMSVQQLYRQVLADMLPLAEAKQIDIGITTTVDAGLSGNPLDFHTLVKNLVDNAIRYTPFGGRVDLALISEPDVLRLEIADFGPGIPVAERERIFDPFYRILGTEEIGSGLGLSIVKTIAQRIGAQITLETAQPETGQGLRVVITLARENSQI
nr:ATP-binding protein [uncultured Desulfobulbus sp.]